MFGRIIRAIGRFFRKIGEKLSSFGSKKTTKAEPKIKEPKIDKSNIKKSKKVKSKPEPIELPESDNKEWIHTQLDSIYLSYDIQKNKNNPNFLLDFKNLYEELNQMIDDGTIKTADQLFAIWYGKIQELEMLY